MMTLTHPWSPSFEESTDKLNNSPRVTPEGDQRWEFSHCITNQLINHTFVSKTGLALVSLGNWPTSLQVLGRVNQISTQSQRRPSLKKMRCKKPLYFCTWSHNIYERRVLNTLAYVCTYSYAFLKMDIVHFLCSLHFMIPHTNWIISWFVISLCFDKYFTFKELYSTH